MSPSHARYAVCAFVLLSAGVAANIMWFQDLQGAGRGGQQRAASERQRRATPEPEAERTASLQGTSQQPMVLNGQPLAVATKAPVKSPNATVDPAAAASGDAPEVIASVQRELQARGYEPGTPDGVAGAVTRAAIMAWEHDHRLPLTGEPTEAVMKAIVLGVSGSAAAQIAAQWQALPKERKARTDQMIRMVQQSLSALGYNLGKVTGRINEDTERAIREFETDQSLAQSGRISGPLVARLARLTNASRPSALR